MTVESLKQALNDRTISQQVTEAAKSAAITARQETSATVNRLNEQVLVDVMQAAGTKKI